MVMDGLFKLDQNTGQHFTSVILEQSVGDHQPCKLGKRGNGITECLHYPCLLDWGLWWGTEGKLPTGDNVTCIGVHSSPAPSTLT